MVSCFHLTSCLLFWSLLRTKMYAYPVFRRTSTQDRLLLGPSEEASRSESAVSGRARSKEEVWAEATAFVQENGGDTNEQFLVLAHCKLQFGKYQGQRFRWLLENSLGYAVYLFVSFSEEEERDNPLSANKHLFLRYTSQIREVGEEVEAFKRKKAVMQEVKKTGDTGCFLVEFGDFKGRSMREVYDDPSKEVQALITYLKTAKARPNTNMALFKEYVLKRQASTPATVPTTTAPGAAASASVPPMTATMKALIASGKLPFCAQRALYHLS